MYKFKMLRHAQILLFYISTLHDLSTRARPTNLTDSDGTSDRNESEMIQSKFLPPHDILESCSSGLTFCEKIPGSTYPSDVISVEIRNVQPLGNDFLQENLIVKMRSEDYDKDENSNLDDYHDGFSICPSIEKIIYPKVGKTKNKELLFILNQEEFLQGVRIELCGEKKAQCAFTETMPWGYESFCRQKYVYKRLVALNGKGKAQPDSFLFPSCCACLIRMNPGRL